MKKKIAVVFLFCVLFFSSLFFSRALAYEKNKFEEKIILTPVLPENQIGPDLGYYNLRVKPNLNQVIELKIKNKSSENTEVKVKVNGAGTNSNGLIDYQLFTEEQGIRDFNNVMKVTDSVVILKPGEEKLVKFEISLPYKEFDGILLGAILIDLGGTDKKKNSIKNKISYTIGVVLSENDNYTEPILDFLSVNVKERSNRTYVETKIGNATPTIIENVHINSVLRKESKVIVSKDLGAVRIAPKSTFNYRIEIPRNENLQPGLYELDMVATSDDHTWKWTESFSISEKQIERLRPVSIKKFQVQPKQVVLISALSLIIGVFITKVFLRWRYRNGS
ncbi:hypothetical protein IGL98_003231 [Enterococcus sp. DIV0840]|uniref:DUF916 and DUF3324 domain-containing protein n=1 Tax=Enterococcus TaxID=1350 RepID=UPI001A8E6076|nr:MULTISPECIES: DUF916 and DUF3324 domain-containing protein [Enterococcus]MBO0434831.1 DUF916 and DUF3324 domain-containing protein [Enterococcus sp. DIV0849a]MBO0475254.1 DUF916 and DUF3324 domain-containing protein [Enterococcus ureasiticus]